MKTLETHEGTEQIGDGGAGMEEERQSLESFLKWASEIGISDSPASHGTGASSCLGQSLVVSHFPDAGGRGLAAARDLRKGELVLKVPESALMTRDNLMKDETLSVAVSNHRSLSSTQVLAVRLLYEVNKKETSWWYPYLLHMPRGYDTLPTFGHFPTQALQVNEAIWAAEKAITKAESDWQEAIPLMKELRLKGRMLSLSAWNWASSSISSRTLHIPWDSAGCFCPVGDLFNYAAPGDDTSISKDGNTTEQFNAEESDVNMARLTDGGYEEAVSSYCFYARSNYRKGEQVLLSYGTYTNLELLEHYGFILENNPNDKAFIPLKPEIFSLCSWPKDSLYIHQDGKPSFALLSALRLWLTPPSQRRSVGHLVYSGSQLSPENEILVLECIAIRCETTLKSFVTSIEEDELVLQTIDKIQDLSSSGGMGVENVVLDIEGEGRAFLEDNGMVDGVSGAKLLQSRVVLRCMDRWRLAVQWRLRYKRILADCIEYCSDSVKELSYAVT